MLNCTEYNMKTYRHNLSKMSAGELNWEGRRISNLWEAGDDEMKDYLTLWQDECKKRNLTLRGIL
jgi:hypothetical protein